MKKYVAFVLVICLLFCFAGCSTGPDISQRSGSNSENGSKGGENSVQTNVDHNEPFTANTRISDVISDAAFGDYGRLIFPVNRGYYSGDTLGELRLAWYSHIDPNKTVEITNYMKSHAETVESIFYDIYSNEEKSVDPAKEDTGLFFFKGDPGARFAICNAGGRMTAYLISYGTQSFGEQKYPMPGTSVIQYTGHKEYTRNDPPAFMCVGENDGIASWRTLESRTNAMKAAGIDTEFHKYPGLGHGFGIGTGTTAEGWLDDAVSFWEK